MDKKIQFDDFLSKFSSPNDARDYLVAEVSGVQRMIEQIDSLMTLRFPVNDRAHSVCVMSFDLLDWSTWRFNKGMLLVHVKDTEDSFTAVWCAHEVTPEIEFNGGQLFWVLKET